MTIFLLVLPTKKRFTRREIFSVTSMLFDPLEFTAPVILKAKLILQNLCRLGLGWDEKIDDEEMLLGKVG